MACALVAAGASAESSFTAPRYTQSFGHEYVISVNGKLDGSIHEELEARGATVTGYLGKGRLLVHGSDEAVGNLRSYEKIANVEVRNARDKIAALASHQDDDNKQHSSGGGRRLEEDEKIATPIELLVNLVNTRFTYQEQENVVTAMKTIVDNFLGENVCTIKKIRANGYLLKLPDSCSVVDANIAMLRLGGIRAVGTMETVEKFHVLNMEGRTITRGSTLTDSSLMNLNGEGEIVGVADTGLDYNMCFFRDYNNETVAIGSGGTANFNHRKVVQYNNYTDAVEGQTRGHGTHVCGSIAGSSEGEFSEYNGMAPNAKLAFFDASRPGSSLIDLPWDTYNDLLMDHYLLGARLHSNSWGSYTNTYTTTSRDFDRFMYDHEDFLVLVAAGNGGSSGDGTVGSPANFKNGVSVGASGNQPQAGGWWQPFIYQELVMSFSARGPTSDGRLKPDVLAPGDVVTSAASDVSMTNENCDVGGMSGTSMSTPITSGTAALIREYYSKGYYPSGVPNPSDSLSPSAALVKATLIHSGQAVYGKRPAPSFEQGFGRVNLENVLLGADNQGDFDLYVEDSPFRRLATGHVSDLCFDVQDTLEFKVTLVWTDAPGVVGTDHALVNDLSLAVVQHDGADSVTAVGNHRFNEDGAELSVGGAGVTFGYTTLGATLDITPPLAAPESVIGSACVNISIISDVAGKVFVHDESLDASAPCTFLEAATNVQNAGGVAMVVKIPRYQTMTLINDDILSTITIPVVTTDDISSFVAGAEVKLGVEGKHQFDNKNNVEQVRVRHSGLVTVLVVGVEVPVFFGQKYSLVITGEFAESTNCPASGLCPLCVNGECEEGECVCENEFWTGVFCDVEVCPEMCSGNGECTLDGCVCEDGYGGDGCDVSHCDGTVTLTGDGGIITHDLTGKPYQNNMFCLWQFTPEVPNTNIRFSWGVWDVDLEDDRDVLYLFDGVDPYTSNVLSAVTGTPRAEEGIFSTFYDASAIFISDYRDTRPGFSVQWEALTCLDDCNDSGECPDEPESDGTCECYYGHSGPGCGMETCTEESCRNGGECTDAGVCQCPVNWWGESCDFTDTMCEGLAVYTALEGAFADGRVMFDWMRYHGGGYLDCGFFVRPAQAEGLSRIEFTLDEFHLVDGYDFVYVFDDLQRTNLLATLTGNMTGQSFEFETRSLYFQFEAYHLTYDTTMNGFEISYMAHYPPVFSMDEYTFTFIGDAMIIINDPWRKPEGVFVGSVFASDPPMTDMTYSLYTNDDSKTYSIGESDGVILAENVPEGGFMYEHVVEACSARSGLCDRARVVMVVLNRDGCLADGECPDSGPVLSPPFHFQFEGGRKAKGEVVGNIKAMDPVHGHAVVRYRTPNKGAELANVYFEVQSNGDIVCIKSLEKYMKGDVFVLPVVACSVSGCSSVDVELEVVRKLE